MTADPKPRRRYVAPRREYAELVRRLLAEHPACELCERRRSESAHHAVPRDYGGDDVYENLVALCGDGTRGCHGEVEHSRHARSRLRLRLRPETVTYAIGRMNEARFDRLYPDKEDA